MENISQWQHPFVDVFKKYNTFEAPKSYKGSVNVIHDPTIARKCFKLTGSILSNNTVTIPDPSSQIKHSNLIGRYIYIEFQSSPQKYFCVHFEIGIKDREPGVRFTFTNMEKEYNLTGGNTLKIPFNSEQGRNRWTIACIDIQHHLQHYGLFSKGIIKNYNGIHTLRGIKICSNMTVRGIYTSSNVYDWPSLPKEMAFKMVKGGRWEDHYHFNYLPKTIDPAEIRKKMKNNQGSSVKQFPSSIVEREQISTHKKKSDSKIQNSIMDHKVQQMPSESYLELNTAFSFSSLHNPDIFFKEGYVYYSAGSILVRRDIETGQQHFMQGHTDYIVAMDQNEDWIVTVQAGSKASVRVWIDHKCICSFQSPYQKVQQIRLSNKKHLAMVGLDPRKSQAILIFDISEIQMTKKPILLAKQISDFNILTLKFSPIQSDKLVSCGRQNIRFWRVKNQHLPGSPVVLNHHARNTIFTVFDFEYSFDDPNPLKQHSELRHIYVGSQNGLLYQINYNTHELEQVYKLHQNSAITSLVVSSGFCVTGGEDKLLRVWQMDFAEFILQANNDGVVTSLMLNEDNSQLSCGTSTGALSILDLSNNNYKTIVRSHTENVQQICYHSYSNSMITLSSDLTIRLWDSDKLEQTYEFSFPANDICICLDGNPNGLNFAAGFKSGVLRIFDIENTCVIEQIKHHEHPIIHIEYSPDGHYLAVLQQKLNMLYSPLHSHQPIKHLPVQLPSKYKHCNFSKDSEKIAIIGDSGTHINIWQLRSLQLEGKIFAGKVVKKVKYQGDCLWAIFQDTSIRRYNTFKMTVEVEMQALHRNRLNSIDFELDNYLLFSVGDDSFVKVWDYSFLRQPHQVFIGHTKNINDIKFHDGKLWTVGSEGVLVWNFHEQGQKFVPPPNFSRQRRATFIKNHGSHLLQQNQSRLNRQTIQQNEEEEEEMVQTMKPAENKIVFSNLLKKTFQSDSNNKFTPQKIESTFQPKEMPFKKSKKRQGKPKLTSSPPTQNIQNNLPYKHFFQQNLIGGQLEYPRKIDEMKQHNKKYKLEYLVGVEPDAHENIVWNFMYGWYAYIYDNLIIVESLNKSRSQRIITLPQKLASIQLTKDFKRMIVSSQYNCNRAKKTDFNQSAQGSVLSSEGEQAEESALASIFIIGLDFTIERKLQFHPRGIQTMKLNDTNKFLISIGNFRQCTICVWDMQFGKLKASSYTLDKLNDFAILKSGQTGGGQKLIDFATVGRDQVHFWVYTKDQKLEYYDVFIKPDEEDTEDPELTTCNYLSYHDTNYLMVGTSKGELLIINPSEDYTTTWRKKICSAQVLNITCTNSRTIIGCGDGCLYIWNHNTSILQSNPTPSFVKINLYYNINGVFADEEGVEGVVATSQAIYYVNFNQQFHSLLAGGVRSKVFFIKTHGQYLLTSHQNGRLKLWNVDTAQQLKTYKWKYPCTQSYFDQSISKLVCFCSNQALKFVNLKKFTKEEMYLPEDAKPDSKLDDFVIHTSNVTFGNIPGRWIFYQKGSIYRFQIMQEGKKKIVKTSKVLQLGYKVKQIHVNPQKNLIIAVSMTGGVNAYNVDYNPNNTNMFSMLMVDRALVDDFSHHKQSKVEGSCDEEKTVHLQISKVLNETYLAINTQSPYVYYRNYMKRITFQKISLASLPTSLTLIETKKDSDVLVGLQEGALIKVNNLDNQQRMKYEGIVNDSVDKITYFKNKNWICLGHPKALSFYSWE